MSRQSRVACTTVCLILHGYVSIPKLIHSWLKPNTRIVSLVIHNHVSRHTQVCIAQFEESIHQKCDFQPLKLKFLASQIYTIHSRIKSNIHQHISRTQLYINSLPWLWNSINLVITCLMFIVANSENTQTCSTN